MFSIDRRKFAVPLVVPFCNLATILLQSRSVWDFPMEREYCVVILPWFFNVKGLARDLGYHDAYVGVGNRSKRMPLHLDATFVRNSDDHSTNSSSNSAVTSISPVTPLITRPSSRGSDSADPEDDREPSSGPKRSGSVSSAKSDKEKRKRSRVTPEQLGHLENFFGVDRSPTAARRREISDLLGMQERQTQIWFQNR